ncbi:hypothetical protein HDU96_007657 [Phlyctochytrium bullatum]|nr:hypothetical protein HDU96_007657 [Phlyctochytrium bullatum]
MENEHDSQVFICGAGPVGLSLALELCRHGVRPCIIDRLAHPCKLSRALAIHARTQELLDYHPGLHDKLKTKGTLGTTLSVHIGGAAKPLLVSISNGMESRFPYMLLLSQCDTEEILEKYLEDSYGVKVRRETRVLDLEVKLDHVIIKTESKSGVQRVFSAKYLVGYRTIIPERFDAEKFERVIGNRVNNQTDYHWISTDEKDPLNLDLGEMEALINERVPGYNITFSNPRWTTAISLQERMVSEFWHKERIFLAGDAAHATLAANLGMLKMGYNGTTSPLVQTEMEASEAGGVVSLVGSRAPDGFVSTYPFSDLDLPDDLMRDFHSKALKTTTGYVLVAIIASRTEGVAWEDVVEEIERLIAICPAASTSVAVVCTASEMEWVRKLAPEILRRRGSVGQEIFLDRDGRLSERFGKRG